ncbi:MAG TPA: glycosyltransferase family 39 protein, partial [Gemmatimonadales bacterium]|nr:glycosyltransferase family 39 protein [Gemmatimonadales bacterium]
MYPSAPRGGRWTALWLGAALAIALGLVVGPGLARPQLTMFDEGFHAVIARNLLDHPFRLALYDTPLIQPRRPDWMLAREWWRSPPLALWQMGLSLSLFGVSALALRLPSALLHVAAAMVTYGIGRRLFGATVGIGAAALQGFSPLLLASVLGQQRSGHLDIALLFWTEVGLLVLIEGARRGRSTWFAAAGLALGVAFLAGDFVALVLPGALIGLWIVTRLPLESAGSYGVRFRDAALVLALAAVPIAVWISHGRASGGELFSQEVANWLPPNPPRIFAPSELVGRLGGYLPGLAVPALLALGLATVRAARHSSDLILAVWVWAGVIPLSLLTGATPALALVALPVMAIGLVHALDLGVRALVRAPRLRPLGVTLGLVVVGGATAAYALDGWHAARRERPDLALLSASRLRTQLPEDAVFILDQSDTTGVYLSLMFWTGRPVYSLSRLQHHQLLLSPAIAGDLVRREGGVPYLLANTPQPDAPPASASAEPYRAYAIGPTPTGAPTVQRADAPPPVGWSHYGGDAAGTKYSPLADIDRTNVARLQLAWIWRTGERPWQSESRRSTPGLFEATPLMFGDTLYLTTPYHRVVALDAETGAQLWSFDPGTYRLGQPLGSYGFVHRGLAAWSDGSRRRLFHASRGRLYALDATTGNLVREFGGTGAVSLVE